MSNVKQLIDKLELGDSVEQWKKECPLGIKGVTVNGKLYIYTGLTYKQLEEDVELSEMINTGAEGTGRAIMNRCVLYPEIDDEHLSECGAFVIQSLSDGIMQMSGFVPDSKPVEL